MNEVKFVFYKNDKCVARKAFYEKYFDEDLGENITTVYVSSTDNLETIRDEDEIGVEEFAKISDAAAAVFSNEIEVELDETQTQVNVFGEISEKEFIAFVDKLKKEVYTYGTLNVVRK